jgi:Ser/Thr protein kinase RdoA (MazF antagonist)
VTADDAGGGQRGLRAVPSPELFEAIHQSYALDASGAVDLGGSSSLNLLMSDHDDRFVVRVYRPYVTEARLNAIQHVRHTLTAQGIPCNRIIPTRQGAASSMFDGRPVEVEPYIEHDAKMDTPERIKSALPLLGHMHSILREMDLDDAAKAPVFANYVAPWDGIGAARRGTRRIRSWHPSPDERQLADSADELAYLVISAEYNLAKQIPLQLVHGDFWDNNVLFNAGQVVLVADFDFMGERARIDDLALTLYYMLLETPEPDNRVSDDAMWALRDLVDVYARGLAEPLTRVEYLALPLAIARQPLWSIGGWVALLDDETSARRHAAGLQPEINLALGIVRDLERWQTAFGD